MVQYQLDTSHKMVKRMLGGVDEDEARRTPSGGLAPIVWQVGHLALTDASFAKMASGAAVPGVPENYGDLFKGGSDGKGDFPSLSQVLEVFETAHQAVARAAAEVNLEEPRESRFGLFRNVGELFLFQIYHRGYHVGKIMSLRALLGKPRLLG